MLKQLRYVATAALVISVTMAGTATAQGTLGFTIDPTQGFPGDTVNGQVSTADINAHCVTDLEAFQAEFQAVFTGPFAGGAAEGDLFSRFFPSGEFVFENLDQRPTASRASSCSELGRISVVPPRPRCHRRL